MMQSGRVTPAVAVGLSVACGLWGCGNGGGEDGKAFEECSTSYQVPELAKPSSKGICIDDTTLRYCPASIPKMFPNSGEQISSIRLFKAWGFGPDWDAPGVLKKEDAWDALVSYVKDNDIKVMLGTQVTCIPEDDDKDWQNVIGLLKRLQPSHVMGLGIGNEMDLACTKEYVNASCCARVWKPSSEYPKGYYYSLWERRVSDLIALKGFEKTLVSPVFSGMMLAGGDGKPFYNCNNPDNCATVNDFLTDVLANAEYKSRFVFSLNTYPYFWDGAYMDKDASGNPLTTCNDALAFALGTDAESYLGKQVTAMRTKMKEVLGEDGILWIGETGWSFPAAETLGTAVKDCADWSSEASFKNSFDTFAGWDLSISGTKPPDHAFYFTLRDSVNFGQQEAFGLIGSCESLDCKLSPGSGPTTPSPPSTTGSASLPDSAKCAGIPACAALGLDATYCCPTVDGANLDCCAATQQQLV